MNRAALVVALVFAGGCAVQPDYRRPALELPRAWKDSAPRPAEAGRWWAIYGDAALDALVGEALERNADVALAVARVDEARALVGAAQARLLPEAGANVGRARALSSTATGLLPPGMPRERNEYRATLEVSYEIDLWGRLRNSLGAAQAELLATEASRETVRVALSAQVVKSYFALRALEAQLALTRRTIALREEALKLQRRRHEGGLSSEYELRQLEAEAAAVRAQLPPLEREREIEGAALAVLAGRSPRAVFEDAPARVAIAEDALMPAVVPSGLPSEMLLRRPDLAEAEQRIVAANARVAAARVAHFPSIALTGLLGTESAALAGLFSGPAGIWRVAAAVAQPIYAGGRVEAETAAAEARERQALAQYQRAVQNAFREVREALAAQARSRESFEAQSERARALGDALRLARLRHESGIASQLEVLDAERGLLAAQSARIEALRAQRTSVADLFRALGG